MIMNIMLLLVQSNKNPALTVANVVSLNLSLLCIVLMLLWDWEVGSNIKFQFVLISVYFTLFYEMWVPLMSSCKKYTTQSYDIYKQNCYNFQILITIMNL